jgi:tRNA 2-thiouridine synthesizing protein A
MSQGDANINEVDAKGLSCPLPLLKAKQALNRMNKGEMLVVWATDAGSVRDFKVFAEQSGNRLLESSEQDGVYRYLLLKGS